MRFTMTGHAQEQGWNTPQKKAGNSAGESAGGRLVRPTRSMGGTTCLRQCFRAPVRVPERPRPELQRAADVPVGLGAAGSFDFSTTALRDTRTLRPTRIACADDLPVQDQDGHNAQQNPYRGHDDRDAREQVTGLGAKRALPSHASQRAGESATTTPLHENEQDQEQGGQKQQECQIERRSSH